MLEHKFRLDSIYSSSVKLTRISLLVLLFVAYALASAPWCSAQVLYGSLTGTVTDPSGAAVTGAKVETLNVGAGVSQLGLTDGNGIYRFTALLPGTYKVTISAPNFSTQVSESVRVAVNGVQRLDARLKVASTAQNVTVTAEAPLLQTDRSDVHTDLNTAQIQSLPSISSEGKSFQALYRIIPGASLPMENNSAGGNPSGR